MVEVLSDATVHRMRHYRKDRLLQMMQELDIPAAYEALRRRARGRHNPLYRELPRRNRRPRILFPIELHLRGLYGVETSIK